MFKSIQNVYVVEPVTHFCITSAAHKISLVSIVYFKTLIRY